jgi:uncharacterized membrane protein YtjA (UPF0391 family)
LQQVAFWRIRKGKTMLYYALVCLLVAIFTGALGFSGVAGTATGLAQLLFFLFLALLLISLVVGLFRRV